MTSASRYIPIIRYIEGKKELCAENFKIDPNETFFEMCKRVFTLRKYAIGLPDYTPFHINASTVSGEEVSFCDEYPYYKKTNEVGCMLINSQRTQVDRDRLVKDIPLVMELKGLKIGYSQKRVDPPVRPCGW